MFETTTCITLNAPIYERAPQPPTAFFASRYNGAPGGEFFFEESRMRLPRHHMCRVVEPLSRHLAHTEHDTLVHRRELLRGVEYFDPIAILQYRRHGYYYGGAPVLFLPPSNRYGKPIYTFWNLFKTAMRWVQLLLSSLAIVFDHCLCILLQHGETRFGGLFDGRILIVEYEILFALELHDDDIDLALNII